MLKLCLTSVAGLLAVTLTFCLALLPAQAQEPELDHFIYLPLILKSGATAPPGPFAKMMASVQQVCSATGPNQVCYVNGQITLEPKTGTIPFNQPGAIANLVDVQRLSLVSTGSDPQKWSLAWLRLAADSGTPDQQLTILAFGNVEISNILPFTGQPPLEDETVLPGLQFASRPVAGVTQAGSSGLIVANSTEDAVLSLTLNGAVVTLASTALVEAQPGSQMSVTMANGFSMIEANGESSVAVQGQQVTLPLNQTGQVSGPPAPAVAVDPGEYLLVDLVKEEEGQAVLALPRLNRAIDRCLAGQSTYVYNVLYWTHVIEKYPYIKSRLDPAQLAQAYERVPQCLTFEIEFNSVMTTTLSAASGSMYIQGQGMIVKYDMNGNLIQPAQMPLTHVYYNIVEHIACFSQHVLTNGTLDLFDSTMRINHNRLDISTKVFPAVIDEHTIFYCEGLPPLDVQSIAFWRLFFRYLHSSEAVDNGMVYLFTPAHWKYTAAVSTGNQILAEAIFSGREYGGYLTGDTWLVMLHKPGH